MTGDYVLPTFLRQTPNELLDEYFSRIGLFADLEIAELKKTKIQPVIDALGDIENKQRSGVEADFRRIHTLANRVGSRIISEQFARFDLETADTLAKMENHYARAMWLFLNPIHNDIHLFDVCHTHAEINAMRFSASRNLRELPKIDPARDPFTIQKMEGALQELYRPQGRGHRCEVRYLFRPNPTRHYYVAYPEDYSTSDLQWEEKGLQRVGRRAAFQVVYRYLQDEGVLEISASGNKKEIQNLQEVFCRLPLGLDGIPGQATDRCYNLNSVKFNDNKLKPPENSQIQSVDVVALRLAMVGNARRRLTVEQDPNSSESVYEFLRRVVNQQEVPLEVMNVNQVRIRVQWYPEGNKRAKTLTFTLSYPDSSTLKDEPRHIEVKKYLKQWGLAS